MSLSQQIINQPISQMNGALIEKITLGNDLSGLSSIEKVQYINHVCNTLGLNPATRPIQLIKFQGKEIPYFTKDATEQLRKINHVSINNLETKILDENLYVVMASAQTNNGRHDSSTGVVNIAGLKGDAMANAMMKAETKAKRRVTLSICGLGFMDESEIDSLPYDQKVNIHVLEDKKVEGFNYDIEESLLDISQVESLGELHEVYTKHYKNCIHIKDKNLLEQLITAKDKRKSELTVKEFNEEINTETGEVLS
jgi:hypothetical protein